MPDETVAEKLPVGRELEPVPVGLIDTMDKLERAIVVADLRFQFLQRVTQIALKRTLEQDWSDFGGKPYLGAAGCERIRPLFGITIDGLRREKFEDNDQNGPYYFWIIDAVAHFHGDSLAVQGKCSSRDQFYASRRGPTGEKILLPSSEVSQIDIIQAAFSNMVMNAVTRILGIRDLTWKQLEELGFDRKKAASISFGGEARGGQGVAKAASGGARPAPSRAPDASPPAGNGGPPDGKSWFTSLRDLVAAYVGDKADSPKGVALLVSVSAYKSFTGWGSWTAFQQKSKNVEQASQIIYARLKERMEREKKPIPMYTPPPSPPPATAADGPPLPVEPPGKEQEGLGL